MDLYKKYINNINKKLPEDFDPHTYLELNPDIVNLLIDKNLILQHYVNFGIIQNRRYKKLIEVDPFFDEHFYLAEYPDVLSYNKDKKFSLKERLFHHYYFYGKKEGRYKNLKEKYSSLINFKNLINKTNHKLDLEHFKNNLECVCLLTTDKEIADGRFDKFIEHLLLNTKKTSKINFKVVVNNNSHKPNIKKLKLIFDKVSVSYLNLSKKDDIYTNKIPKKIPKYGLKSGPNIMFFKTIEMCRQYNTTLMLEVDCILNKNWIKNICCYVKNSNGFLISGAINDNNIALAPNSINLNHINGGTALYATGSNVLQKLVEILALFIEDQTKNKNNISLAYDCALKILIDNGISISNIQTEIRDFWKFINRNYLFNNFIFNYSLPQDSNIDIDLINKKYNYAILHKKIIN